MVYPWWAHMYYRTLRPSEVRYAHLLSSRTPLSPREVGAMIAKYRPTVPISLFRELVSRGVGGLCCLEFAFHEVQKEQFHKAKEVNIFLDSTQEELRRTEEAVDFATKEHEKEKGMRDRTANTFTVTHKVGSLKKSYKVTSDSPMSEIIKALMDALEKRSNQDESV